MSVSAGVQWTNVRWPPFPIKILLFTIGKNCHLRLFTISHFLELRQKVLPCFFQNLQYP